MLLSTLLTKKYAEYEVNKENHKILIINNLLSI